MTEGLCHCGCGSITPISKKTSTRDHTVKGLHNKFLRGHAPRKIWLKKLLPYDCLDCGSELIALTANTKFCEKCKVKRQRAFDKIKQKQRREDPNYKIKYRLYAILKNYGLTEEKYNQLLQIQNNKCAICINPPLGPKSLHVDHNHKTGEIRGLLCSSCNNMIGLCKESVNILMNAINYLNKEN